MENVQNPPPPHLVLASQSPVRKSILTDAGLKFETVSAAVEERKLEDGFQASARPLADLAIALAQAKARKVSHSRHNDWIIGADQVLVCDGSVLHKPRSAAEAAQRLKFLSGRAHHLHTAFSLCRGGKQIAVHCSTARMVMRDLMPHEIDQVIGLDPEGACQTPGAYRIETPAIQIFSAVEGDHFAILGLPLLPLLAQLRVHAPHLLIASHSCPR